MAVGSVGARDATGAPPSFARRHPALLFVIFALALGVAEVGAWREYARREVVFAYPIGGDQVQYGLQSFRLCQSIRERGFAPSLRSYLAQPNPTGSLVQLQGGVWCAAVAAGWLPLLTVNFLYFLLLQAVTAGVAWYVGGRRWRWAVMAIGLILALRGPYFIAGGLMDFRLDLAALCLYGTLVALVLRSAVFTSRGWSLAAGAVAAMLVWGRTLTLAYLLGVGAALAAYLLLRRGRQARPQLVNLGLAACVIAGLAVPVVALQFRALRAYYWVGHVVGIEPAIRARELGITGPLGHVSFYPISLVSTHLGGAFLAVGGLILLAAVVVRLREPSGTSPGARGLVADRLVVCALALVVPLAVLTADVGKSAVVVGITTPAVVWLVLLASMRLGGTRLSDGRLGMLLAGAALATGIAATSSRLTQPLFAPAERPAVAQLVDAYERMSTTVTAGTDRPRGFSAFSITEYLWPQLADFIAFDRHRRFIDLTGELGYTIFATSLDEARAKIDRSLFVITSAQRPVRDLLLPFDVSIQPWIPELTRYVRERFVRMGEFEFRGLRHGVYRRPFPRLSGISGDWITGEGLVIEIDERDKRGASRVLVRGWSNMNLVPGLRVSATAAGHPSPLPVDFQVHGDDYSISVSVAGPAASPGPLRLMLEFSTYFVPKDIGLGPDPRRLVLWRPKECQILFDAP